MKTIPHVILRNSDSGNNHQHALYPIFSALIMFTLLTVSSSSLWSQATTSQSKTADSLKAISMLHSTSFLRSSKPDSALLILYQTLDFIKESGNSALAPRVHNRIMGIYMSKGMLDSAIQVGRKSIKTARSMNPDQMIFSARFLGEAFHKSGQSDSALVYLLEAERVKTPEIKNSSIHLYILLDLIDVYGFLNDDKKCRHYRKKAREYLKSTSSLSKADRIIAMHDLLRVDLNLYDTVSFSNALSEYQDLVKPFEADISLPQYHTEMFQFTTDSQVDWITQLEGTIPVHRNLKRWDNIALAYYLLSQSIHAQGGQTDRALAMLDSCIQVGKKHNLTHVLGTAFAFRERLYSATGNYASAYQASKVNHQFQDSINTLELKKSIEGLHVKFETEQKEKQILEQKIELRNKERQRNLLLLGIIGIGMIAFLIEFIRRVNLKNKELAHFKEIAGKDKKIAESHMQMLRAQMNPHFLFNSLNSIKHFIIKKPRDASAKYISIFSKLMRLNLQNSSEVLISLEQEFEFLKQYLLMEQMRFEEPFDVIWDIDEHINLHEYLFPPMLIQPYLENAIWHGLRYKKGKGSIHIVLRPGIGDKLVCTIEDDGVGRARSEELKSSKVSLKKSMGTRITEDRISMTNSMLNSDIEVKTKDLVNDLGEPSGTLVTIQIPQINESPE